MEYRDVLVRRHRRGLKSTGTNFPARLGGATAIEALRAAGYQSPTARLPAPERPARNRR